MLQNCHRACLLTYYELMHSPIRLPAICSREYKIHYLYGVMCVVAGLESTVLYGVSRLPQLALELKVLDAPTRFLRNFTTSIRNRVQRSDSLQILYRDIKATKLEAVNCATANSNYSFGGTEL